jgi:hypothetical protein
MNDLQHLKHLLADPEALLESLDQREAALHSTSAATSGTPQIRFGVQRTESNKPDTAPKIRLASLFQEQRAVLGSFRDATEAKRSEMFLTERLKLFSVIFAEFRPGPAYRKNHEILPTMLQQRTHPGGPTWLSVFQNLPHNVWARHAVRLDNSGGLHRGSGTIFADGSFLTAAHVIGPPGYLFGTPPAQAATAQAQFNCLVGGPEVTLPLQGFSVSSALDFAWLKASAQWPTVLAASDFAANTGLPLQKTVPEYKLASRLVAVIGHPAAPGPEDASAAQLAYGDAPYGMKRLMPGLLSPSEPLVTRDGVEYLRHDCSTLGGASGGLLIDLETGVILGIHTNGRNLNSGDDRNLAVPAWNIVDQSIT